MIRSLRFLVLSVAAVGLASCSGANLLGGLTGGNLGGVLGGGGSCNPGTQVQLANPLPFATGVSPNIGSVTIVASGNNNYLYSNYQSMNITLLDNFGDQIPGGTLQLVSYPNGPHPYNSDFYYQSNFGTLQSNTTYTAYLTLVNGFGGFNSCSYALQSFQT
ncbi:MAG TPA: hypothetical protein VGR69_06635 [Candidatus Rubrimentiphilum sp.]|nr:hypothetical protein [Candidatus Rubrimentiphilum sp.]